MILWSIQCPSIYPATLHAPDLQMMLWYIKCHSVLTLLLHCMLLISLERWRYSTWSYDPSSVPVYTLWLHCMLLILRRGSNWCVSWWSMCANLPDLFGEISATTAMSKLSVYRVTQYAHRDAKAGCCRVCPVISICVSQSDLMTDLLWLYAAADVHTGPRWRHSTRDNNSRHASGVPVRASLRTTDLSHHRYTVSYHQLSFLSNLGVEAVLDLVLATPATIWPSTDFP